MMTVTRTNAGANDDWESESAESIRQTSAAVGAFPLGTSSKDAAAILHLAPGPYIVEVASTSATESGEVLTEVYILP